MSDIPYIGDILLLRNKAACFVEYTNRHVKSKKALIFRGLF